jgi:5,10-methenyltetrahydromethanopterin hydrogenase
MKNELKEFLLGAVVGGVILFAFIHKVYDEDKRLQVELEQAQKRLEAEGDPENMLPRVRELIQNIKLRQNHLNNA